MTRRQPARNQRTSERWFDPSAANILEGPGLVNLDVSIAFTFRIGESISLDFRSEFFNLFNEAHFTIPNAVVNTANAGAISETASSAPNPVWA